MSAPIYFEYAVHFVKSEAQQAHVLFSSPQSFSAQDSITYTVMQLKSKSMINIPCHKVIRSVPHSEILDSKPDDHP